jgi:diphthamide biosynthesis methyltransferase
MKEHLSEPIRTNTLTTPLTNGEDIITTKFDFVTRIFGYDLVYVDFYFQVGKQDWVELRAKHHLHGDRIIAWGRSELEATDKAFDEAWELASSHTKYGDWVEVTK